MRDTLLILPEDFSVPSDGHSLHLLSFYPLSAATASSPQRQQPVQGRIPDWQLKITYPKRLKENDVQTDCTSFGSVLLTHFIVLRIYSKHFNLP